MLQASNQYLKYTSISFGVFLLISLIFFFSDNSGDINWLNYEEALNKANYENKPIMLYIHNKWVANNKIANKTLFSNDSVVNFVNKNFIPAKIDFNKKEDKELLKKRYNVDFSNYTLVLDKFGRSLSFLDNSWSSAMFINFAEEVLNFPSLKFDDFDAAKEKSKQTHKPLLIFVINTYFQNVELNAKLKDTNQFNYINDNFIPISLMSYNDRDLMILSLYYSSDDPVMKFNKIEKISNDLQYSTAPNPNILIVSIENGILGKIELDKNFKDNIKEKIEENINHK